MNLNIKSKVIQVALYLLIVLVSAAKSDDDSAYDQKLEKVWTSKMRNFIPNDYLTV